MGADEGIRYAAADAVGRAFVERHRRERPAFLCVLAYTETCLRPGISAAGISEALRPLTPAADAEVVTFGQPRCLPVLPSNPNGTPGPSGITRAALRLAGIEPVFLGLGLPVWPSAPCVRISERPGRDIAEPPAVPDARHLFDTGLAFGERASRSAPYLVIGESVPGGTTTALAVLVALGIHAEGRVSGSQPDNAHALKSHVVQAALRAAGLRPGDGRDDPLAAVGAVGDPMQPFVAGLAHGATRAGCDVLLAGGSQMLAVAAVLAALRGQQSLDRVAIGTTRWIVDDPGADICGLASEISSRLPVLAAALDFSTSRHSGLHAYEHCLVKEGVGAGGASIAAMLATGCSIAALQAAIEVAYDELLVHSCEPSA